MGSPASRQRGEQSRESDSRMCFQENTVMEIGNWGREGKANQDGSTEQSEGHFRTVLQGALVTVYYALSCPNQMQGLDCLYLPPTPSLVTGFFLGHLQTRAPMTSLHTGKETSSRLKVALCQKENATATGKKNKLGANGQKMSKGFEDIWAESAKHYICVCMYVCIYVIIFQKS